MPARPVFPMRCSRRSFLLGLGGVGAAAIGAAAWPRGGSRAPVAATDAARAGGLHAIRRTSQAMGCTIEMTVLHADAAGGERALDAAFAELARVENAMSLYRPGSDLCRLNRAGILQHADPYLIEVLTASRDMARRSGGAFDVTVQPLWALYARAQKSGMVPTDAQIEEARHYVDWRGVEIAGDTVRLQRPGMAITLNGIAQGFAADRAVDALKRHGVEHALINTGEIASLGQKGAGSPWTVGIQHPRQQDAYLGLARLDGRCMSTSGDYETSFTGDRSSNHIFEPATGRSPQSLSSVTVVADTATQADALSTALFVLGADKGTQLAREYGADVLLVTKTGRQLATPGFPWTRESEVRS